MSGGHGLPHADDHGHYPEHDLLHDLHERGYELKPHELRNIKEIERKLKSKHHLSHHELHEYQHFLEHFSHHLKEILQQEAGDHIHNTTLENELRRVATLHSEVSARLNHH